MNSLISRVSVMFRDCSFPVYVYLPDQGAFYQVVAGQHEKVPVPVTMRSYLDSDETFFQSF